MRCVTCAEYNDNSVFRGTEIPRRVEVRAIIVRSCVAGAPLGRKPLCMLQHSYGAAR